MQMKLIIGGAEPPEPEDEPTCCEGEFAERIDAMFQALPAEGVAQIAAEVGCSASQINTALIHLRRHEVEHGWTVPHAKRGKTVEGVNRFFVILVDKDGTYLDAETRKPIERGARGTLTEVHAKTRNQSKALRAVAEHIRQPSVKRRIVDLAADHEYIARKTAVVAAELAETG